MATPTPAKQHIPTSTQAVATPPVSTPFSTSNFPHPAFSPHGHGHRSVVPSPQQVKKSPANSQTLYGYPSGGNHPTNSSFGVGYDSPSAAMALGGGMDLGIDGGLGVGAGGIGGVGGARGDEEERRRKLGVVVEILKANKGHLSEPGMERLAKRVGLECLWETHMGSSSGTPMRTLVIAGSHLALEIDFANNVVKKVALSFPESPEIVTRHTDKAGDILLRDLQFGEGEGPLTKMLDKFAGNLERLANADKLSTEGLNCHEAIAGIYESLVKLHLWEVEKLGKEGEMAGKDGDFIERMALCAKSGKPVMHTRDRLGLSLDYWESKRRLARKTKSKEDVQTWSLLVECAPLSSPLFPALRVSSNWLSTDIQKANPVGELFSDDSFGLVLDWLEPENTLLTATEPPGGDAMEGIGQTSGKKVPEVMLVARFDPPLIVPMTLAMQIYNSTSVQFDVFSQTNTFDGLMFPHGPNESVEPGEARTIETETEVPVFDSNGERTVHTHRNTLLIEKIDYGRTMTELPFSHPRQLVEMLPYLRQYAFLTTVLGKTFGGKAKHIQKVEVSPQKSKRDAFKDFMSQSSPLPKSPKDAKTTSKSFKMDVTLTTQPLRLRVVFPFKQETADVMFDIKLNGVVEVVSQNILGGDGKGKGKGLTVGDLGRMLEVCEDLGTWVEFVRRRLG
ncbi:mediator of RNA polymerase II transcription subunit 1-domain-containing protein [Tricladium varicosporioides]|nr:mediator of RNA polymerase II transcription subunit 1-domain-containing protein [Hymenoscyphus varicosporioides]